MISSYLYEPQLPTRLGNCEGTYRNRLTYNKLQRAYNEMDDKLHSVNKSHVAHILTFVDRIEDRNVRAARRSASYFSTDGAFI